MVADIEILRKKLAEMDTYIDELQKLQIYSLDELRGNSFLDQEGTRRRDLQPPGRAGAISGCRLDKGPGVQIAVNKPV